MERDLVDRVIRLGEGKSQTVRLIDVFVLAPFMFYFGYKAKGVSEIERYLMYGMGVATLIYNANNYLWIQEAQRDERILRGCAWANNRR